jgi:GNAT superfamily N-acetyltransferase
MEPQLRFSDTPPPDAFRELWTTLLRFNEAAVGEATFHTLAVLLTEAASEAPIGGLWGRSLWGSLYIDILFVPETWRGRGIGTKLVAAAEAEGIRRGCHVMWTDTYAFQARPFYEKLGFTVFGRLDGPAPMFPHVFLKKDLGRR